ncbi:uncharacterized protein LOC134027230 isoform X2 [Osmerus eperlanus]|uniref:uncharacterized protein LOC134027230 isoform X2 n=1 Tax=Osmerus eperlanus TaxID=29151 RepID=UPI002E141801
MELLSSDIIIKSCEKRIFPKILLPHWLIQVLSHLGRMAFCLWPFCSPPPPNKTLFSSLPAWVTVGLDFTPEEFIALFQCESDHWRSMAFCITEKLFPYLSAVMAGFVVYHFFKAYKRRQFTSFPKSHEMLSVAAILSEQLKHGLAMKQALVEGLKDVEIRLLALEQRLLMVEKTGQGRRKKALGSKGRELTYDDSKWCQSSGESEVESNCSGREAMLSKPLL